MSMQKKKCLAVLMGFNNHMLDHIAPLAYTLNIPLLITEDNNYEIAKEFYPMVDTFFIDRTELVYEQLAQKYDALFRCTFSSAMYVRYFADLLKKETKLIYCPHGNSDKGHVDHSLLEHMKTQDGVLLYGQHMINRLKNQGHWDTMPPYVMTGNYRLEFYLQNKQFYENLVNKNIFEKLPKTTYTLLYAPTWNDYENLSSFFDRTKELIEYLPEDIALIIKPHPLLEEKSPAQFFATIPSHLPERVSILENFPTIYPILDKIDGYIGDFSSIGYDMLSFPKKAIFLFDSPHVKNSHAKQIHTAGIVLKKRKQALFSEIKAHLEKPTLQKEKQKLYSYTFGEKKSKQEIQQAVASIL